MGNLIMNGIKKGLDVAVKEASDKYKELKKRNKKLEKENAKLLAVKRQAIETNIAIVASNLLKLGIKYEMIAEAFHVPDTVIAGGFVLQCITGDSWHTDIDIITEHPHTVIQKLTMLNETVKEIPRQSVYKNCMKGIQTLWRGTFSNGVRVDIIQVADVKDAVNTFDLDFCKCTFDGSRIHIYHPQSIITRTHVISNDKSKVPQHMRESRIKKYMRRGFHILNSDHTPYAITGEEMRFPLESPMVEKIEEDEEESSSKSPQTDNIPDYSDEESDSEHGVVDRSNITVPNYAGTPTPPKSNVLQGG